MPDFQTEARAYATIAEAIRYLHRHAPRQPRLAEVAAAVGLSEFHLQRLFGAWAGVSPKRFLQYLTKEHAKRLLREDRDVLAAAVEAGLSGPGRLHELLVSCDAVSPGEVRARGRGLAIRYAFRPTPFGEALLASTARGVCHLAFADAGREPALAALRQAWPEASLVADPQHGGALVEALFARAGTGEPLHLWLRGTNFQIKVWEALLQVPRGGLTSYSRLAQRVGRPGAARAVAGVVAANPLAVLIPCHRVIRETGELGGYRWGLERKAALLAWEAGSATLR